jgi:hypothetical protein
LEYLDDIFELLPREISNALKAIAQTEDLSQKKAYSEIVLNLSKSMSVFYDALDMQMPDFFDEYEDHDDFDDFDEMVGLKDRGFKPTLVESDKTKKSRKSKKKFN